jgi:xylulokinase
MALLLGIDLGTSYFKVGLFDESGTVRGLGRVAVEPQSPGPGRFELPVSLFWQRLRRALDDALHQAGATAEAIAGISYSSQANTLVLLATDGLPLTPLIFWHDQRAAPVDDDLAAFGRTEEHGRVTGLVGVTPGRASVKCRWFARHQPEIWARTRWIMTISDYLTHALTDLRLGDASTAVLTGLYSLPGRDWWPAALATFGIDGAQLSRPLTPGQRHRRHGCRLRAPGSDFRPGSPMPWVRWITTPPRSVPDLGTWADASLSTGTVLAALVLVDAIKPEAGCIHGPSCG